MAQNLVYSIFKEMAVLEGLRDVDGTWRTHDAGKIRRTLAEAYVTVRRQSVLPDAE